MSMNVFLLLFVGWLVPGLGHFLLGIKRKALVFFFLLTGLFVLGLTLHAGLGLMGVQGKSVNFLTWVLFGSQFINGGISLLCWVMPFGMEDAYAPYYEVGQIAIYISGLLNILILVNLFDEYRLKRKEE